MMRKLAKSSMCLFALLAARLVFAQDRMPDTNTVTVATNSASTAEGFDERSFQIISQRNIFNPNRSGRRSSSTRTTRVARTDAFTLVGTLSYAKGQFAIFDGNSSSYRKSLTISNTIAGYTITQISPNFVMLGATSNKVFKLPVGSQMRRPQGGHWNIAGEVDAALNENATPAVAGSDTNAPGDGATPPSDTSSGYMTSGTMSAVGSGRSAVGSSAEETMRRLMLKRESEK